MSPGAAVANHSYHCHLVQVNDEPCTQQGGLRLHPEQVPLHQAKIINTAGSRNLLDLGVGELQENKDKNK